MTWKLNDTSLTEVPNSAIGFVYMITNLTNGKRYIGKKSFYSSQTRTKTVVLKTTGVKKKKKIRSKVESDWRDYYGSSDSLKDEVSEQGTETFKREILRLCYTKGELSYYEAKYQFEYDVLLNPSEWYNSWISVRVQRTHLKNLLSTTS